MYHKMHEKDKIGQKPAKKGQKGYYKISISIENIQKK